MEAFLNAWLPGFLPQHCTFGIYPQRGKDALLRKIGDRLRGYANWMPAECFRRSREYGYPMPGR